jgi:predicted nuclease of predicted toxin-antitoxin system
MSLAIVIDMNLSAEWVAVFESEGWRAVHWSHVGDPRAEDSEIMDWARANQYVVLTHDLDFTAALALTGSSGPSVIQVRTQRVLPEHLRKILVTAIQTYEQELIAGSLVVVEALRSRVRILPL